MTTSLPLSLISDIPQSWSTDSQGNQTPQGWLRNSLPNGTLQIWPQKSQGGQMVESRVGVQPECVHDLTFAPNEQPGGTRAILWPGQGMSYKVFHGPSSTILARTVDGLTPGRRVRLTAAILPDVNDIPRGASGQLEPDHCRMSIVLTGAMTETIEREWSALRTHHDYPGSERPWNVFGLEVVVPPSGSIAVRVSVQSNWRNDPDGVAWFFGPFTLTYTDAPPPPPPDDPPPDDPPDPGEIDALRARVAALETALAELESRIQHFTIYIFAGDDPILNTLRANTLAEANRLGLSKHLFEEVDLP